MSAIAAKYHIVLIEKKGFIDQQAGKPRSIRVNEIIKVKSPLEIYQVTIRLPSGYHQVTIGDSADEQIKDGDSVYLRGGRLTGITRELK